MIHSPRSSDCIDEHIDDVIERYSSMVYKIAFTKTRTRHDAEDVYQEVFLRYIKSARAFDSEEHRKAWLIRVTLNCANKLLSSSWFSQTEPLDENLAHPDQSMLGDDERDLWRAVKNLPDKYKTVVYLFYCENMTTAQIAKTLRTSEGNVRVRLSRARKMLKIDLEGGDGGEQA
jgi:RNA polymerase sigma-70 factor (ECF subfamily)